MNMHELTSIVQLTTSFDWLVRVKSRRLMLGTCQLDFISGMEQARNSDCQFEVLSALLGKNKTGHVTYYTLNEANQLTRNIVVKKPKHEAFICSVFPHALKLKRSGQTSSKLSIAYKNILQVVRYREDDCILFLLCRKKDRGTTTFCVVLSVSSSEKVSEMVKLIKAENSDAVCWDDGPRVMTRTRQNSLYC